MQVNIVRTVNSVYGYGVKQVGYLNGICDTKSGKRCKKSSFIFTCVLYMYKVWTKND